MVLGDIERLSDVTKLSAHVTRVLGQNPGMMTLQGTNSYILQPPSNSLAPMILIDTSSPHTAQQYVDCLFTHLHHLGLESGTREVHFESTYAEKALEAVPDENVDQVKANLVGDRLDNPRQDETELVEYGPNSKWAPAATAARRLPAVEHIILTHRHLDHVGAVPTLLKTLAKFGLPPPKIWKFPNPDEVELAGVERDRPTTDAALLGNLPQGLYTPFSPFQPFHPIIPGLMISIIDPVYKHLLKYDKDGKPKWNDVPEIARVSLRCLRTPGHTADSVSLIMCEGEKGVFTGDTVLGSGTTVITDLAAYMVSLKTLLALKPNVLYPAHGAHVPTAEKSAAHIQEYITHRQQREDQILALLTECSSPGVLAEKISAHLAELNVKKADKVKYDAEFHSGKPYKPKAKSPESEEKEKKAEEEEKEKIKAWETQTSVPVPMICRLVYQSNDEKLIFAANRSVGAHLQKLEGEGKAEKVEVNVPKIIDGEITPSEEQEAWRVKKADDGA